LDKEHKAIERVIEARRVDPLSVRRLHASTLNDLLQAIQKERYDVVHFSGHGSEEGIYLEDEQTGHGELVSADKISKAMAQDTPFTAALFVSCFSASMVAKVLPIAHYLITVVGEAGDTAAIRFVEAFYNEYFTSSSIEQSFDQGFKHVELNDETSLLKPVLSRRALATAGNRLVVQVPLSNRQDSLLIDMTEAEESIKQLGIAQQDLLYLLNRKIRVHRWIFDQPKERTFLPVGSYFGIFSWSDRRDVIRCHRVMAIRDTVDEDTCSIWASMVVQYNDLWAARYRREDSFPYDLRNLKQAVLKFKDVLAYFFYSDRSNLIRNVCPKDFKAAQASINANLCMAEAKVHEEDAKSCIQYLEMALSTLHDVVDAFAAHVLRS
jgi:hypothetical protein